jgi:hypothetical protein
MYHEHITWHDGEEYCESQIDLEVWCRSRHQLAHLQDAKCRDCERAICLHSAEEYLDMGVTTKPCIECGLRFHLSGL